MRKLFILLLVCVCSFANAQNVLVVKDKQGKESMFPIWNIEEVTIKGQEAERGNVATPVDMGLKVKWSSWNIGAEKPEDKGFLFGWGSKYHDNHSTDNSYFPNNEHKTNITCTDYDAAKALWGGMWRMPTATDIQELIEKCNWEWIAEKNGWEISNNTNTNKIFLPVTGKRTGEDISDENVGYYWTGECESNDGDVPAKAYTFSETENGFELLARHIGAAIRPVYGELVLPYAVSSQGANVEAEKVYITVVTEGKASDITYGIYYATKLEDLENPAKRTKVSNSGKITEKGSEFFTIILNNLAYNTKYYYKSFLVVGKTEITEINTHNFTTQSKYPAPTEAVDLGLSVDWSPWNMGGSETTSVGGYYVFADALGTGTSSAIGNLTNIGGTQYDIATTAWGKGWRLPTPEEFQELFNKCTYEWKDYSIIEKDPNTGKIIIIKDGPAGLELTGTNGNKIFLPDAGYYTPGSTTLERWLIQGSYWTSKTDESFSAIAAAFQFDNTLTILKGTHRNARLSIRPVYVKNPLTPEEEEQKRKEEEERQKELERQAQGDSNAEAVDLGLTSGTKWASLNLGANNSHEGGNLYAWGETEPNAAGYTVETYNYHHDGEYDLIGKEFSEKTSYGYTIANTEYDAAKSLWHGNWHMPTDAQFYELINECTWTLGVGGYTITGKNGKSIFIPFAPYYSGFSPAYYDGIYCWSSIMFNSDKHNKSWYLMYLTKDSKPSVDIMSRERGLTIRAVR